jgi:small conductance mechanosensitive channel
MILKTLQIDIAPILTGAGILGVVASFSAQTLIRDIIAGLFILLENQYAPGMRVRVDSVEGVVENISLRSTTIRCDDGSLIFVPNGGIQIIHVMPERKRGHVSRDGGI